MPVIRRVLTLDSLVFFFTLSLCRRLLGINISAEPATDGTPDRFVLVVRRGPVAQFTHPLLHAHVDSWGGGSSKFLSSIRRRQYSSIRTSFSHYPGTSLPFFHDQLARVPQSARARRLAPRLPVNKISSSTSTLGSVPLQRLASFRCRRLLVRRVVKVPLVDTSTPVLVDALLIVYHR